MVYISKVYTKSGDGGDTMLADGTKVRKDSQRIRTYGDIDELNAVVGLVRLELTREDASKDPDFLRELDGQLARLQQELFNLGAELATPHDAKLRIETRHIEQIERDIDGWNDSLEPLKSFILPGGGPVASAAHLARTVCRRAERELVTLASNTSIREEAQIYVNRISDYFFVVSRAAAKRLGHAEVLWDPSSV